LKNNFVKQNFVYLKTVSKNTFIAFLYSWNYAWETRLMPKCQAAQRAAFFLQKKLINVAGGQCT